MTLEMFAGLRNTREFSHAPEGLNCWGCAQPFTTEDATYVQRQVGGVWRLFAIHPSIECARLLDERIARGELTFAA